MATKKKKITPKKVSVKKSRTVKGFQPKSFEVIESPKPFMTFKITRQTVYWLILLAFISVLTLWILKLQLDILTILDNLNLN
jgi:hypothetical protein